MHLARHNGSSAFFAHFSSDLTFMDISIFAGPSASYVDMHNSFSNFIRCSTVPKEGRWLSTAADGIYSIMNRGGPWIEGCAFESIGDDGLVVKTYGMSCIEKIDDKTLVLVGRSNYMGHRRPVVAEPGDVLRAFDPKNGSFIGEAQIVSAEPEARMRGPVRVVLDRELPDLRPGTEWESHILYNDAAVSSSFVMRNNTLKNLRRWGILCQSHDGVIENNHIEGTLAQAIRVTNADMGIHDGDGFAARNIVIRNNVFKQCHLQRPYTRFAAMVSIAMIGVTDAKTPFLSSIAPWQGHQSITIEDNTFIDWLDSPALCVSSAHEVVVRGNTFERADGTSVSGSEESPAAIYVFNASDVTLERNSISGTWKRPENALVIDRDTTKDIESIGNAIAVK